MYTTFAMFRIFALLPILSVVALTVNPLDGRQDATDCTTPCTALSDAVTAASPGGLASLCTSAIVNDYANCYSCEVKVAGMTQTDAQETIDGFVQGCNAGNHHVDDVTISADGSVGAGSTSTPSTGSGSTAKTGAAVRTSAGMLGVTSALILAVATVI
ncbi:hypothetical protein B0H12DRAFT_690878 [Mycena haematopus]|nr:hypothetical protein B0H12DRAFT_690878 [Mycena haematopus]